MSAVNLTNIQISEPRTGDMRQMIDDLEAHAACPRRKHADALRQMILDHDARKRDWNSRPMLYLERLHQRRYRS